MKNINYQLAIELSNDIEILKQISKTTGALALVSGTANIIPNKNILLNTLGIQESKSSNEIENIFATNSEVFEEMATGNEIGNSKEIINYSNAFKAAKRHISKRPITLMMLEEIQSYVEPVRSGIRKTQVHIGNVNTGEIIHMPPAPNEVKEYLDDLIKFINIDFEEVDVNPLVNTIMSHYQFETIHPFLDGNGRTGRILIIMQLIEYGYFEQPILYLSRYINKTRSQYYKHLQSVGKNQNFESWKSFILYYLLAMEVIAKDTKLIIVEIDNLLSNTKEKILSINFKRNSDIHLIELLFSHTYFTREMYDEYLGVKKNTSLNDLNLLIEAGILTRVEKSSYTYYINNSLYELLDGSSENLRTQ